MPKLLIHENGQQSVFELFDDETTIGRGAANVVQVTDAHSSKHQAVVRKVAGRIKLIDLESKNGTRVNGEFRNQRWLEHGDVVTIGAMTMTYDADAAGGGVAAAAAAAVPLVSGPALSASAPAPARSKPASRPARSRRARDDDHDDDGDDRGRVPARRGSNSVSVGILVGLGVIGLIVLLFVLLGSMGVSGNTSALQTAKHRYEKQNRPLREVREWLAANTDPNDRDSYVSVRDKLAEWDALLANEKADEKREEARKVMNKIQFDQVEQWKNRISDEDFGRRLLKFLEDYKGTATAMELENSPNKPYPALRAFIEKARAANK